MLEKSPFTMWDFLQQRKRWLQGLLLTVHSPKIDAAHKVPYLQYLIYRIFNDEFEMLLALSVYAWTTMPVTSLQLFLCPLFPLPK